MILLSLLFSSFFIVLVLGLRVTGEIGSQDATEKDQANDPVHATLLLKRPRLKHPQYVQKNTYNQNVRAPAVDIADKLAERDVALQFV